MRCKTAYRRIGLHSGILTRSSRLTGSITHAPSGTVKFLKPLFCSLGDCSSAGIQNCIYKSYGRWRRFIPVSPLPIEAFPDISSDRLPQYFLTMAPVGDAFCLAGLENSLGIYKVSPEGDLGTCVRNSPYPPTH